MIYLPLAFSIVLLAGYSYMTSAFDDHLQRCLQEVTDAPSPSNRKKMVPFVGCLKKKSNFFLSKIVNEDRLYQYANPKLPCSYIGKWHVSTAYKEFWLTIAANADTRIEQIQYLPNLEQKLTLVSTGIWSADNGKVIQFADDGFFWPLNESKVRWYDVKHFVMYDSMDEPSYFYRHSELEPNCRYAP